MGVAVESGSGSKNRTVKLMEAETLPERAVTVAVPLSGKSERVTLAVPPWVVTTGLSNLPKVVVKTTTVPSTTGEPIWFRTSAVTVKVTGLPTGASMLVGLARSSIEAAPSPPRTASPAAGPPGSIGFNSSSLHPFANITKAKKKKTVTLKTRRSRDNLLFNVHFRKLTPDFLHFQFPVLKTCSLCKGSALCTVKAIPKSISTSCWIGIRA